MGIDPAIIVQDVDARQVVALASGKVIGVVGGRDFDCSSTKTHVHQLSVLNDGHLAPIQWMDHKLSMQLLVPAHILCQLHSQPFWLLDCTPGCLILKNGCRLLNSV